MPRGRCVEIRHLQDEVTVAASIWWVLCGHFYHTAGTALIALRKSGCVVPAWLCIDPLARASNIWSLHLCCIDLLPVKSGCVIPVRRAVIFSPQCRLCVISCGL
ncbi:hypothetical protein NDU88_006257 [Pleurodeles waltl]|uniref:Uncharacterized protein n=1 Tax=Pleurodeles waltl TaxID=8319 RepID=A0AAV7SP79_PLEWA|nr:hypothetical protein NDU88_006257 [Pleurodeles waltl]